MVKRTAKTPIILDQATCRCLQLPKEDILKTIKTSFVATVEEAKNMELSMT